MRRTIILIPILGILFCTMTYAQKLTPSEANKLADDWNKTISENINLTFEKNKAILDWADVNEVLDLRSKYAIPNDSICKDTILQKTKPSGMYTVPIYWKYNFKHIKSSKTSFRANKSGLLFLKIEFQQKDTINIKSQLNAYSSVHRTTDSAPHLVQWIGNKYLSVLLQPEKINDTIRFQANGITISGKFQRDDKWEINKYFTKKFRAILKREFKLLFSELNFVENSNQGYQIIH